MAIQCGDRELWVMCGDYESGTDEKWAIPFFATPYSNNPVVQYYHLEGAVFMNGEMLDAVELRLKPYNKGKDGQKIVLAEHLKAMAYKAPGVTPEYYLDWRTFEKENQNQVALGEVVEPADLSSEAQAFCEHIARTTQVVPYGTMKLVWRVLMSEGLAWLVERKKPINLGFVRLVPVPYRSNWKQILFAMFPKSGWSLKQQKAQREAWMVESGFTAHLYNTKLASLHRYHHIFHWELEATPQEPWWKAVEDYEKKMLGSIGPGRYADYFRNSIKRALPNILAAYRAWLGRICHPCAGLDTGRLFGRKILRPWVPDKKVLPKAVNDISTIIVASDDPTKLAGPEFQGDGPEEAGGVPEVPCLLPEKEDVWISGDESGMLVLDAAQGEDKEVPVLAEGAGPGGQVE